ncbi:YggS family pyridoxal phosphate-dependent enzyme [Echinimonas agarilytica]|uniref:Pyridoxal phosphate homeostasis protein n=1 Tax=Echinimonas agarilytica TaxID=1215918 RepID=A0AA42B6P8_9GAMM|nr:YggS family pyridoxal phosphate-dependent enzyme [Echinimonas agarilytica]MCM2678910.1 YggS family pyridoxal phosphate-dependent enzyme [Echinimonas agarilytica]
MQTLTERFAAANDQVQFAAQKFGRAPNSVKMLAVSKTKPVSEIEQVAALGQLDFGENYSQEAIEKAQRLSHLELNWHFIGPIQSNKTKGLAEHMAWVHTISRDKIAQRLNDQRPSSLPALNICIQVNVSQEDQKAGVSIEQLPQLVSQIETLPNLSLRGLMAIVENTNDTQRLTEQFATMRSLFNALKAEHPSVDTLSMGMSQDLELAIQHGSTMVRIGTAIFGQRQPKKES